MSLEKVSNKDTHDGDDKPTTLIAVGGTRDTEIMTRIRALESRLASLEKVLDRLISLTNSHSDRYRKL